MVEKADAAIIQRMGPGHQIFESFLDGKVFQLIEKCVGKVTTPDGRIENDISLVVWFFLIFKPALKMRDFIVEEQLQRVPGDKSFNFAVDFCNQKSGVLYFFKGENSVVILSRFQPSG